MAAMVGARRALLAARYSPRSALTAALVSPARRADSPPSLQAERGSLRSLVSHRSAGSLASERVDGDYHREWGAHNAGNYGESSSKRPTDHLNHQLQRDLPSAGSSTDVDRNRGEHVGGSANAHYGRNPEQPFQTGGSYGLPDSRQPYSGAKVNNETPGYNARQPYGSSTAYNPQSPKGDIPNARQQHNGTQANDDFSGYGKVQTYHHSYGYDTYRFGYNNQSNQQSYTSGQYGYGPSGQSYQNSTGNYQNKGVHVGGSANAHYGCNAEQPYQSGGSYGLSNSRQPYTGARVNNETPARQPYGSSSAYSPQSPKGDLPNAHQQHNGTQANNGLSGYGKVQTYHHSNGYDTHSFGYDTQSNQQSYTGGQYGYGPSGQSYQNSTGNYQNRGVHVGGSASAHYGHNPEQPYQSGGSYGLPNSRQPYTGARANNETPGYNAKQPYGGSSAYNHQSPGRNFTNRPGNSASQYPNPSGFRKEHVAGFQQGHNGDFGYNASQAYQSPYVTSKVDTQSNHPGCSINVNTDVQCNHHGIYQEKHSDIQPIATAGNNLNSTPYQDGIYCHRSVPGSLSNDGSPSEVSEEASGKSEGTIEELEKLCEDGKVKEALEVLALLQEKGIVLHAPQYFKLMQACGDASALAEAREIHNKISQSELAVDTDVNNKILEMYAKCGSMEDAKKLLSNMAQHDLTSWNTMISGFVHNGLGEEATDFFHQFKQTGDKPDPGMFTHVFLACGILGSVDEGMLHFESMQKDFGITPTMEHYASIVNLLGQSGYIDEAREFVERVPVEPSIDVWESLMNMCRLNGILELGDRCAQIIERLDPSRLNEQSKVGLFPVSASDLAKEKERKRANAVEPRSEVHGYRAGDRSHPQHLKIYEELRYLAAHMKEAGYIADTRFVLHDVDQETKEDALLAHSERLAASYGLITSAVRAPMRIIKNLRSCGDCHTALKIISKLVGRQIIARDAKRFHHFENGVCSCKDYW